MAEADDVAAVEPRRRGDLLAVDVGAVGGPQVQGPNRRAAPLELRVLA